MSKMEQIIARAIRLCSHGDLPEKRKYVDVYYHASVLSSYPNYNRHIQSEFREIDPKLIYFKDLSRSTIEQKMYITSEKKQEINVQFELALKQSSVDCNLNKNGNIVRLEETVIPSIKDSGILNDGKMIPLYNRSNNKYYLLENKKLIGIDMLETVEVQTVTKSKKIKTVRNWPPIGFVRNKVSIKLTDWQIQKIGENKSVTLLEDTLFESGKKCDISSDIGKKNFMELYKFAMSKGEEYSAWRYAYDMFRKLELFPKLAVKYGFMRGSGSASLQNCLHGLVQNASTNKIWDSFDSKERKSKINALESMLLKSKALKDKDKLIAKLRNKVPYDIKQKLGEYTYSELDILSEKLSLREKLRNNKDISSGIKDKLEEYSIQDLRLLNKKKK
jgi:hypothetical protein